MPNTVRVLPSTDEHTLCVELTGLVNEQDHRRNLRGRLAEMTEKNGWYNMLILFGPGYQGWEMSAAEISMQSIIEYGKFARKLAYVNPPEKTIFKNKMTAPLLGGEIRYFDQGEIEEAIAWVKN